MLTHPVEYDAEFVLHVCTKHFIPSFVHIYHGLNSWPRRLRDFLSSSKSVCRLIAAFVTFRDTAGTKIVVNAKDSMAYPPFDKRKSSQR